MTGTVAVVTGANRGIGRCVADLLASEGATIVLACRSLENAEATLESLSDGQRSFIAAELDVTNGESVRAFASMLSERFEQVDILINNAGVALDKFRAFEDTCADVFSDTLAVNTLGTYRVTQALLPLLKRSAAPRVVNVSSQLGSLERMTGATVAYRASKAALNAMTRALAHELADSPAKVNSVCPGWVATELGGLDAPRTPEQAAPGIVWAAMLPPDGPTGGFFQDGEALPW